MVIRFEIRLYSIKIVKMRTIKFQNRIDNLIDKFFLWAIPDTWHPNNFTYFRIATVPIIYLLLERGNYISAFVLFIFSASTDFIDGALARTRDQITELGKLLDPIADKMLLATILVFIGIDYVVVQIFLVVIGLEIIGVILESVLAYKIGRPLGANLYGKVKMIFQCLAAGLFLLGIMVKNNNILDLSEIILFIALFFAFLAGIEQVRLKYIEVKAHIKRRRTTTN